MDQEQLRAALIQSIDYYTSLTLSVDWQKWGVVISVVGALAAAITAVIMYRTMRKTVAAMEAQMCQQKTTSENEGERYLAERWDQVFKACILHPAFLDATQTENFSSMTPKDQLRYSAFCYSLWDLVNEMVRRDAVKGVRDRALLNWSRELHGAWLKRNPDFFPDDKLWDAIKEVGQRTHMIVRYKPLPQKDNEIDWKEIAPRYHESILSPMAPSMLADRPDGKEARNPLVERLRKKAAKVQEDCKAKRRESPLLKVLELGCGPGTIVDALVAAGVTNLDLLVMVDSNEGVLNYAESRAKGKIQASIHTVRADMRKLGREELKEQISYDGGFDVVLSINSILFTERLDVIACFKKCRDLCAAGADVFFILPSFDTTEYLERLWFAAARKNSSPAHGLRVAQAFRENKKMDRMRGLFADDGHNVQGYHSPATFKKELEEAGLGIIDYVPVYYDWESCRSFDYGYFPNAKELIESVPKEEITKLENEGKLERPQHWNGEPCDEIWDWFVQAR